MLPTWVVYQGSDLITAASVVRFWIFTIQTRSGRLTRKDEVTFALAVCDELDQARTIRIGAPAHITGTSGIRIQHARTWGTYSEVVKHWGG